MKTNQAQTNLDELETPIVQTVWAECEKCHRNTQHRRVVYKKEEYWTCPCGCKTTRTPTAERRLQTTETRIPDRTKHYDDFKRNEERRYRKDRNREDWE